MTNRSRPESPDEDQLDLFGFEGLDIPDGQLDPFTPGAPNGRTILSQLDEKDHSEVVRETHMDGQ